MRFQNREFVKAIRAKMYKQCEKKYLGVRPFASEIGVSHSTLNRIITENTTSPDIDTILKICSWLRFPIQKFIKK